MNAAPEPGSLAEHVARLLAVEAAADTIHGWSPRLIPGLLQSRAYASAALVASAPALPPHDVDAITAARLTRIDTLGKAADRRASFVISADVLTRAIGGPAVLAEQLGHLLDTVALRPSLSLRVLPADADTHAGLAGAFTGYTTAGRRTVFIETLSGGLIIDRPERTLVYSSAWDHLEEQAATPAASLRLIEAAWTRATSQTN